ncbi:hypothetical protein KEM55_006506, partial [Ascosphaera atra]
KYGLIVLFSLGVCLIPVDILRLPITPKGTAQTTRITTSYVEAFLQALVANVPTLYGLIHSIGIESPKSSIKSFDESRRSSYVPTAAQAPTSQPFVPPAVPRRPNVRTGGFETELREHFHSQGGGDFDPTRDTTVFDESLRCSGDNRVQRPHTAPPSPTTLALRDARLSGDFDTKLGEHFGHRGPGDIMSPTAKDDEASRERGARPRLGARSQTAPSSPARWDTGSGHPSNDTQRHAREDTGNNLYKHISNEDSDDTRSERSTTSNYINQST